MSGCARFAACALAALAAASVQAGDIRRGAELYQRHCARCHGANGAGVWPGTPNLARREGLMQTDAALLATLRKGRGAKPGYQGMMSEAQILDVIAYARTLAR